MADNNNIDLLEPFNLDIDEIPQIQRKRKVDVPTKKEMRLREIQAKQFLCVMLAFIISWRLKNIMYMQFSMNPLHIVHYLIYLNI